MKTVFRYILIIFSAMIALVTYGNPEGFQVSVTNPVTPDTEVIDFVGENKTGNFVGEPYVDTFEKKVGDEWVDVVGSYLITEAYSTYSPNGFYPWKKQILVSQSGIDGPGEYRAVIKFDLKQPFYAKTGWTHHTTYAYFTVIGAE